MFRGGGQKPMPQIRFEKSHRPGSHIAALVLKSLVLRTHLGSAYQGTKRHPCAVSSRNTAEPVHLHGRSLTDGLVSRVKGLTLRPLRDVDLRYEDAACQPRGLLHGLKSGARHPHPSRGHMSSHPPPTRLSTGRGEVGRGVSLGVASVWLVKLDTALPCNSWKISDLAKCPGFLESVLSITM